MTASQDYRDGAAWGAHELARRATVLHSFGIDPAPSFLDSMAGQIRHDMGGSLPDEDPYDALTPSQRARVDAEMTNAALGNGAWHHRAEESK